MQPPKKISDSYSTPQNTWNKKGFILDVIKVNKYRSSLQHWNEEFLFMVCVSK